LDLRKFEILMDILYNYGISQEDVLTELKALDLKNDDSLLCIASAGEIPLNVAAMADVRVTAVDTSENQIRLCRIKQASALFNDSVKAASFLGYMKMDENERERIYRDEISGCLPADDRKFWVSCLPVIRGGVVNAGRFENFMRKVTGVGRLIVGEKNLYKLFECETIEEQQDVFDRKIKGPLVNAIFRIAFHPWVYRNRGIDPAGLTHSGARNIGEFFFNRFRNFCCSSISRNNYFLQYTFFNEVLFREALPEFLQPTYFDRLSRNACSIEYITDPLEKILGAYESGRFNKIHISNIGDWMSVNEVADIFRMIRDKTSPGAKIVMRYIHLNHKIPDYLPELLADYSLGQKLEAKDRYPFYSIVPILRS
jgi:S-adenosylmethionine:diacylglycerol 3-amino-3-carboxypropyl transferase